jgi:Dimethlysulfonioproprionate lyase
LRGNDIGSATVILSLRPLVVAFRELLASALQAHAFLRDWPRELTPRPLVARPLPVVSFLVGSSRYAALARDLDWRQTYSSADFGERFLQNYGWSEWIGPWGMFESDAIACGVLLLRRDTEYSAHSHKAEELYLPWRGSASTPGRRRGSPKGVRKDARLSTGYARALTPPRGSGRCPPWSCWPARPSDRVRTAKTIAEKRRGGPAQSPRSGTERSEGAPQALDDDGPMRPRRPLLLIPDTDSRYATPALRDPGRSLDCRAMWRP